MITHRWTVQYAERSRGDIGSYVVVKGNRRKQFLTKPEAIAEAQLLNGWQVDGNEGTYAAQATAADREHRNRGA